jgi:heterodisulfide reductase subunit A
MLIVGGGIAGVSVADALADAGLKSVIIERDPDIGGHVRNWPCMATDQCRRCFCCLIEDRVSEARSSALIEVMTGSELLSISPSAEGGKTARVRDGRTGAEEHLQVSAVVVAIGFQPYNPSEKVLWGYGRLEGVHTLAEVGAMLRADAAASLTGGSDKARVAFIQCVGSRDASVGADYCSQYCCKTALRTALKLLHECPGISVALFYIDLQIAGKYAGALLSEAQRKGVRLLQGAPGEITPNADNHLEVVVEQQGRNVRECFDRVILSIGQRPQTGVSSLAERLGISLNEFGFLATKSVLEDFRTAVPGVYAVGTCVKPMDIEKTLAHAGQCAAAIIADQQGGRSS